MRVFVVEGGEDGDSKAASAKPFVCCVGERTIRGVDSGREAVRIVLTCKWIEMEHQRPTVAMPAKAMHTPQAARTVVHTRQRRACTILLNLELRSELLDIAEATRLKGRRNAWQGGD
eukprot:scaffold1386_cov342-Pavlova_lutheri.AAC.19